MVTSEEIHYNPSKKMTELYENNIKKPKYFLVTIVAFALNTVHLTLKNIDLNHL